MSLYPQGSGISRSEPRYCAETVGICTTVNRFGLRFVLDMYRHADSRTRKKLANTGQRLAEKEDDDSESRLSERELLDT